VSQIVVPLGLCALIQATRGLRPADIWTAILFGHIIRCALSVLRFRQGKWRTIQVEVAPPPHHPLRPLDTDIPGKQR
jgi:Na+-driven multidrug efflux pump